MCVDKTKIVTIYDTIICDDYTFYGTADEIKKQINEVLEKADSKGMIEEGVFDVVLEDDYYGSKRIKIEYRFKRLETEEEKTKRIERDAEVKKARKLKESADYAEFLRLKEKFKDV